MLNMKRLVLLSLLLFPIFLFAQYPTFSNKQKLGVQTTGDGLIYRGDLEIPNYQPSNVNNAYFYLDTVRNTLKFYKGGWIQIYPAPQFDTTTLNVYLKISDTTAMLLPYFRDSDTTQLNLINRFALKLNISDTSVMLSPYLRKADTISLSNRINLKLNISDTTILSNRITTNANNIITINTKLDTKLDTIYKKLKNVVTRVLNKDTLDLGGSLTEGYGINIIGDSINVDTTIIFTQSDTITLSNRIDNKLNISDTVSLSNRIDLKLNKTDTINLSNRIDLKLNSTDTISLSNRINIKLNPSDTVSLSNRINLKLDTIYVQYQNYLDTIVNKDTINISNTLTEGFGINIIADSINIDSAVILNTQQKQIAYVKNQSGTTMYKGQAVYSSGSTGDNKLVQLASSNTEQASSKTFGIVETDSIPNGSHGYIITFGVLSGFNTNGLTEGSSVYLSNTLGQLTTTKPVAPLHSVTIGICIREQQNNGSIFVKIQNGFELNELHDVLITSPVNNASLYYSGGLWRDTTATLLVSDTTNMLSKYVNTYGNQTEINGDKTFNNVITIDSATVTGKLLVNTNISDAVKINSNTNSTNLELMNSGGSVYIKSSNKNMTLQTDTTVLMYLNGETNRVGILTMSPEQALEVAGTIRVDSLGSNTLTPTKLVGANDANDLSDVKLGTGLFISNDTLKLNDNIINLGDTATLLRDDYYSITTNKLVWTEGNKKLIPYFTQVYRNGQLLKLDDQYSFSGINNDTITLEEGSYKLGDNITIIAIDNIVALAGSGGVITLQGDVTGSGASSITTTIGTGKVTNTMLAGSISNDKLNTITTVGKVSNSATTATSNNTTNAIVSRNSSGDFTAGTITASLNGNANTSTTLATGRTISITGDLTYTSPSFNGSTNITAVGTLANSGVTANTYTAATITVDAKGRVTSASNNTIPTVNDATLTLAVSGNGLTGSQSFTANQSSPATFTVTSNATKDNTPSTIVFRDALGNFSANIITAANGFLGNATSSTNASFAASVTNYLNTNEVFKFRSNSNNTGQRIINFPDGDISVARINGAQTFTGTQTFSSTISGNIDGSASTITGVYGGTITSSQITTGLGFTPYNATNPNSYITSSALTPYATLASPTFTGTVSGITKTMVGLSNVDNTSDVNKPVSTATQTALDLKQNTLSNASTTVNGILTAANFNIFNDKQTALVSGISIKTINNVNLLSSGNLDVQTVLNAATSSVSGFLLANDWVTFNGKQNALNGTGFVKASGATISYDNTSYLPLSGGTITNGSDAILALQPGDNNMASRIQFKHFGTIRQEIVKPNSTGNLQFRSYPTGTATGGYDFYVSNGSTELLAVTIGTDKSLSLTGTLSVTGATTLSTTSATPTTLLGKDGSNVVGTVTSVNQTGIIGRGSTTNQVTNSSGEITIAHGLGWTPIMAFANLPASTTNIVNVKSVDATNIVFIIRDAATGNPLNGGSVSKVEWLAIK